MWTSCSLLSLPYDPILRRLLAEGAQAYYEALTAELAHRFGIEDLARRSPAHATLKAPFETEEIDEFKEELRVLSERLRPVAFPIRGLASFGTKAIVLDVAADRELVESATAIVKTLAPFGTRAAVLPQPLHLHLSIARFLDPDTHARITAYLDTLPSPSFDLVFDNLTLFRHEGRWLVDTVYRFS